MARRGRRPEGAFRSERAVEGAKLWLLAALLEEVEATLRMMVGILSAALVLEGSLASCKMAMSCVSAGGWLSNHRCC